MKATIVQFAAGLTLPDAVRLQAEYGLKLDRYILDRSYLERLPPETVERLRGDFLVRGCTPLDPSLKLAPSISNQQPTPDVPIEFTATMFDDADPASVEALLNDAGAHAVQIVDDRPIGGTAHVRFDLDDLIRLDQVAQIDDLVWIEPVPPIVSNSVNVDAAKTIQSIQYGVVGRSPIWDQGLHGEGQVIGMIDQGIIDVDHCFFEDLLPNEPGPSHRKVLKIFNESGSPVAEHPTWVAGIAAGDEFGDSGKNPNRGGAWMAKLVCSNVQDLQRPKSRSLLYLLKQDKDAGAVIHTNSWGNSKSSFYDGRARDVDSFSWANEDHLVLAAGANTGEVNAPPGTAKNALCVAAAKAFPDEMSRGSGVDGPTKDRRRKPEIMAVGGWLEVATPGTACLTHVEKQYATSFATPHAAAAAAMVRQYFMEGFYPYGKRLYQFRFTPTGALLKAVLLNSTVDVTGEPGYPSNAEGWGLIRLDRTLYFDGGPRRLAVKDVRTDFGMDLRSGEKRTYHFFVNDRTEQLKITLVWTDIPPSEHDYAHPVRNLIKMTAKPDDENWLGWEYQGNDFEVNSSGVSSGISDPMSNGATDEFNNVQMIIVNDPTIGEWKVTLSAHSDSADFFNDRQGYALVASGGLDLLGFLSQ